MPGRVKIDFGEYRCFEGDVFLPRIVNDIERAIAADICISVITLQDYRSPENALIGGRTEFPRFRLPDENEFVIKVNPNLVDNSVFIHELCHVYITVLGYPRHFYAKEEYPLFNYSICIPELVANLVQHKWINKYLKSSGFDTKVGQRKYYDGLSQLTFSKTNDLWQDFFDAVNFIKAISDFPEYSRRITKVKNRQSPQLRKIFDDLRSELLSGKVKIDNPKAMFKSLVVCLNSVGKYKDRLFGDSISLQAVNYLYPVFIDESNRGKPAKRYFRYWVYGLKDELRPFVLKVVYLYKGNENMIVGLAGVGISRDHYKERLADFVNQLSSSNVEEFLNCLLAEGFITNKCFQFTS